MGVWHFSGARLRGTLTLNGDEKLPLGGIAEHVDLFAFPVT